MPAIAKEQIKENLTNESLSFHFDSDDDKESKCHQDAITSQEPLTQKKTSSSNNLFFEIFNGITSYLKTTTTTPKMNENMIIHENCDKNTNRLNRSISELKEEDDELEFVFDNNESNDASSLDSKTRLGIVPMSRSTISVTLE